MENEIPEGETLSREYLANERTLLSWIRTGINAISMGMLLAVVLRALDATPGVSSTAFGISLISFGALLEVVAVARFVQYKRSVRRGRFTSSSLVYLLIALGLSILGVAYITYILVT
ncbi:MAG: DUF202 domain-containing protein [Actinomycetota bacterium]